MHQSKDKCAGGTEKFFVGYPTLGQASGYWPRPVGSQPVDCGAGDFDPLTEDIEWIFWYGKPGSWGSQLAIEDLWDPVCVISETIGGRGVQANTNGVPVNQRWTPALGFDVDTQNFHILLSTSKYWHNHGGNAPDDRGTRIIQVVYDGTNPPAQEELSPVTIAGPTGAGVNCTLIHPDDECFVEQFAPSIAVMLPFNSAHFDWAGAAWHDTRLTVNTNSGSGGPGTGAPALFNDAPQMRVSQLDGVVGSWQPVQQVANGGGVPFVNTGTNGNTPWGDYESMAADIGSTGLTHPPAFYPAWGDNRDGTTTTQIFTAEVTP